MNKKIILTAILASVISLIILLMCYKKISENLEADIIYSEPMESFISESDKITYDMIINMMSIPESKCADKLYLQGMIYHHQYSVKLSELYENYKGDNNELKNIVYGIIKKENKELDIMNKLMQQNEIIDESKALHYINEYNSAMASSDVINHKYSSIDEVFVKTITEYNKIAIDISDIIIKYGNNSEVKSLAVNISQYLINKNDELNKAMN